MGAKELWEWLSIQFFLVVELGDRYSKRYLLVLGSRLISPGRIIFRSTVHTAHIWQKELAIRPITTWQPFFKNRNFNIGAQLGEVILYSMKQQNKP